MMETKDQVALIRLGPGAHDAGKFRLDVNHGRVVIGTEGLVYLLRLLPKEVWDAYRATQQENDTKDGKPA